MARLGTVLDRAIDRGVDFRHEFLRHGAVGFGQAVGMGEERATPAQDSKILNVSGGADFTTDRDDIRFGLTQALGRRWPMFVADVMRGIGGGDGLGTLDWFCRRFGKARPKAGLGPGRRNSRFGAFLGFELFEHPFEYATPQGQPRIAGHDTTCERNGRLDRLTPSDVQKGIKKSIKAK